MTFLIGLSGVSSSSSGSSSTVELAQPRAVLVGNKFFEPLICGLLRDDKHTSTQADLSQSTEFKLNRENLTVLSNDEDIRLALKEKGEDGLGSRLSRVAKAINSNSHESKLSEAINTLFQHTFFSKYLRNELFIVRSCKATKAGKSFSDASVQTDAPEAMLLAAKDRQLLERFPSEDASPKIVARSDSLSNFLSNRRKNPQNRPFFHQKSS